MRQKVIMPCMIMLICGRYPVSVFEQHNFTEYKIESTDGSTSKANKNSSNVV
jgi:hypothetical protein